MGVSGRIDGLDALPQRLPSGEARADSALHRLKAAGKTFLLLKQRGRFADIAFDHGRLLASEIEDGVLPEITATSERSINLGSRLDHRIAAAVHRAMSDRVLSGASDEFREAVMALADGYLGATATPRYGRQQIFDALVAIEVGNLIAGVARRLALPLARAEMAQRLSALVSPGLTDAEAAAQLAAAAGDPAAGAAIAAILAQMSHPNTRWDFACTAFAVPASLTRDGRHLHARSLDADLYRWNRAPILFLTDETADGGRCRYVAFATAGLLYPGGVSGLNEKGLAVSLHQLSTTRIALGAAVGEGDIAPFVQQRLLRDAASLDDAVDIVRSRRHFAAWTFFCSDARRGDALRIEVNGEAVHVSRCDRHWMAQTNHFLGADMVERLFDVTDGHFTASFGKWLETRARFELVEDRLAAAAGAVDTPWAIDLLASGQDQLLAEIALRTGRPADGIAALRSYGRVPRKVYGQMASIVRGDPGGEARRDEIWMTVGDRQPAPHSLYVGWTIDWQSFEVAPAQPLALRRTEQYATAKLAHWERSLERYLWARMTECRPKDASGELLRRAVTPAEQRDGRERAEYLLTLAIDAAGEDGVVEVSYLYMRARMRHHLGRHDEAKADWDLLRDIWAIQMRRPRILEAVWPVRPRELPLLCDYEAGLILILSVLTEDQRHGSAGWHERQERVSEGWHLLRQVRERYFGEDGPVHPDLERWLVIAAELRDGGQVCTPIPEPNFVTVE
ncbi:MAG: C45 family autoproteolytic acyltransferase/hydrolase [Rhodospirillales bacterium]|jgi:hypothetical protein|nr:C45 family autoproteolytic acyltransferase/hydrolase [Rhodospirillales bacterium]